MFVQWFGPSVGAVALFVAEILQIVIIAVAIIAAVRYFLVKPFVVNGKSMEPNFFNSEYLIIDELTYRFRNPERGEVVVFHPENTCSEATARPVISEEYYIKRVIGLPGERVEIRDGKVTIHNDAYPNGVVLDEFYADDATYMADGSERTFVVPEGQYFLMGDNRAESYDSRMLCAQPIGNIIGKAWVRGFPIDRMAVIGSPEYDF